MRAALLNAQSNPYMVEHWLRHYEQVWADEVDELRVVVDGHMAAPSALPFIREAVERRGGVYMEPVAGQGAALRALIESTEADTVMLCEPDAYVRFTGAVESRFEHVEDAEVVIGSPRGTRDRGYMSPGVLRAASQQLGVPFPGLWPAFLFAPRRALLATDRDFGTTHWAPGQRVAGLDWTATEPEESDTFGAAAIQLRAANPVIHEPQGIVLDDWLTPDPNAPWFHICSLAFSFDLCEPTSAQGFVPGDNFEWSHRLYWCWRFLRKTPGVLPEFRARYAHNLDRVREAVDVWATSVESWENTADALVTWDEC